MFLGSSDGDCSDVAEIEHLIDQIDVVSCGLLNGRPILILFGLRNLFLF